MKIIRRYREVGWKLLACTFLYWAWVRKIGPLEAGSVQAVRVGSLANAGLAVCHRVLYAKDLKSRTNVLLERAGFYTQYTHLLLFVVLSPVLTVGLHRISGTWSCYFQVMQTIGAIMYLYHGYLVGVRALQDDKDEKRKNRDQASGIE